MARSRSPNYPSISLPDAIEAIRAIFDEDHRNKIDQKTAANHMGHNSLNGRALSKLSALKKYGLLEGEDDQFRVSQNAVAILVDEPGAPDRKRAIAEAFAAPELFRTLSAHFEGNRPSETNLRSFLVKSDFTQEAAERATKSYLESLDLVTKECGGYIPPKSGGESDAKDVEKPDGAQQHIKVGDYVQYESGGVLRLPEPVRVTGFSPDGTFVFVEGYSSGIPIADAKKAEPPPAKSEANPLRRPAMKPGAKQDVFSLPEGEVVIQWPDPLTADSFSDMESWVELVLRKIKRSIREQTEEAAH